MRLHCFVLLLLLFAVKNTEAQTDSLPERSLHVIYENDVFAQQDYYYTQGIRIELDLPAFRENPMSAMLLRLREGKSASYSLSLNTEGFTPTSIKSDSILKGDRPYAGTVFLGFGKTFLNPQKHLRLLSELDLGIIGPAALGYESQKNIHRITGNPIPHGWQYQISNAPVVNYSAALEKGIFNLPFMDFTASAKLRAGTEYDDGRIGATLRIGKLNSYFETPSRSDKFQFWIYNKAELEGVAYNATLQGGITGKSVYTIPSSDISRGVFSDALGLVLQYKKLQLEYGDVFITPEFKNGRTHSWGHCGLVVLF